jgi:arylsulfatase A-like enzyme
MQSPNILWIVTTQWRASALGGAGDPNARTPCLDALAARSVNFIEAVTPHPFGPFARAAMLTGVRSPENGVKDYFDPLPIGSRTIAHALEELGYATAFFGKWHLGKRDPAAPLVGEAHARIVVPPEARGGFGFWEGFESGFQLNDPWLHGTRLAVPTRFSGYQSDVVCEQAADWAGAMGRTGEPGGVNRPWFCMVSLEAPHPPYDAPAAGIAACDPAVINLRPNVPADSRIDRRARLELAGYYAHLEATDRAVGRLMETLEPTGPKARGTAVAFTSAHGDMHGAHGLFRKGWPYEESVRVPLLIRIPGTLPRRDEAAVSLADLPALTLDLATRGQLGAARPEFARISMPSVVSLPFQCDRVWSGLRSKTRKLVLDAAGQPWLFFDLERDPFELENLAGDPVRAREIAELAAWIESPP